MMYTVDKGKKEEESLLPLYPRFGFIFLFDVVVFLAENPSEDL